MASEPLTPAELAALLQGPARTAPPGVPYNLENPKNTVYTWWAVTFGICFGISTLAVFMRLYTRLYLIKIRGVEDLLCFVGWIVFIGYAITSSILVLHGGGVHQWDVRLGEAIDIFFFIYVSELLYGIMILLLKTSILFQYRRVFTPTKRSDLMYWGTHLLTAIIFIYYIAITFFVAFQCGPVKKAWDPLIQGGHCLNNQRINISSGYFNVITDFAILLLPYEVIWNLQMPIRRKAAVSAIFLVGLFACVSSILRLIYSYKVEGTGDITYYIVGLGLWTYAEIASCIICGCLPVFPRFYQSMRQNWRNSTSERSSHSWNSLRTRTYERTSIPAAVSVNNSGGSGPSQNRGKSSYELEEQELTGGRRKTSQWPESGEPSVEIL